MDNKMKITVDRRRFMKRCVIGGCALGWSVLTLEDFLTREPSQGLRVGFRNDAPESLWKWSKKAMWTEESGRLVRCRLCPHGCVLGENDRGFCRSRVVKDGRLHTIVYGNPCAVHLDPVEKKPLYHFLPGTAILSVATAGCNLRCLNCQNWQISQARPEETRNYDLLPEPLVQVCTERQIPSLAYTYSEPITFYEYVYDSAKLARQQQIRNVLVTAGFIEEEPLRHLCKVIDAANVDLKGFSDYFYRKITGAKLEPVMRCLEVMREEGVWIEVTRLLVPTLSDNLDDIRAMCDWLVAALGPSTPLHLSRFHPQHKLKHLPQTPVETMVQAYEIAKGSGLNFVYVGNVPGNPYQDTSCPACGELVIRRQGYTIKKNLLAKGRCPCGEILAGVWI